MAKCNLLKPRLNSDGGTFYTFSQWADDMTLQNALGDAYRIVPSRFACFNIRLNESSKPGEILQNMFEHKCAALRHYMDLDTNPEKFTPKEASILFWNALAETGGFNIKDPWDEMVFVGEMDLQGTNYIDGVSYSELYCIVPANAKKMSGWKPASNLSSPDIVFTNAEAYGLPFGWFNLPDGVTSNGAQHPDVSAKTYYDGPAIFTTEDNQTRYSSLNTLDSLHQVYIKDILTSGKYFDLTSDSSFEFNAVALFYDIVAKDEDNNYHYIYTAVPMGMYFTQNGTPVQKFVTNDEIYGQGTSYGLRVTTKFSAESVVTESGTGVSSSNSQITASTGDLYPEISAVMDRFNAAAEALDDYTDKMQDDLEQLMIHLSNFKDNKANVPYIREIKGPGDAKPEKYWFVNGRSTGVKVSDTYNIFVNSETGQDLEDMISGLIDDALSGNGELNDIIDNSINEYFTNHSISQILDTGNYIRYIPTNKYYGNTTITEIPQTEDFQDIYGENGRDLFYGCKNLERIPRLELHNVTSLQGAFMNCKKLKSLYLADTISCENFTSAFHGCGSLENLIIDATSAKIFDDAFEDCKNLKNLRIYNIDPNLMHDGNINLYKTNIDFASLESIVMSMKSQIYDPTFDSIGPSKVIYITVPNSIDPNNNSVNDLVYNAQMNKNIKVIITNFNN